MQKILSLLAAVLMLNFTTPPADRGTLRIKVKNISSLEGMVWIGIYDSEENFLIKEKAIVKGYDVYALEIMDITLTEFPFGTYALAIFHDTNNNGELDKNIIGIPSEPFAFSAPPRSKWRVPRFDEVKFEFKNDRQLLTTSLRGWWD